MKNYTYLSQCEDFRLVLEHYSEEQLEDFEQAIKEYEESEKSEEDFETQSFYGYADIINWYEGTMTTEQLFVFVETLKK